MTKKFDFLKPLSGACAKAEAKLCSLFKPVYRAENMTYIFDLIHENERHYELFYSIFCRCYDDLGPKFELTSSSDFTFWTRD